MKRPTRVAAGLCVTVLVLGLAGCGGSGSDGDEAPLDPQEGGTLKIGTLDDPEVFEPFRWTAANFPFLDSMYEGLVSGVGDKVEPELAESWEMSEDQTSITFTLREGVKFSTGNALTADDVVATFDRAKNPETGGANIGGLIVDLKSATSVDDRNVRFDLVGPRLESTLMTVFPKIPIIDSESMENLETDPAGTGPFILQGYRPGVSATLKRNPDYWGEPALLDTLEFEFFSDADALSAAFNSGNINFVMSAPIPTLGSFDEERLVPGVVGGTVNNIVLNTKLPPFDNPLVRQAMWRAVNRQGIVQSVYNGFSVPRVLPWADSNPAHDPTALEEYAYDLDKARDLVEESGVTDLTTNMIVNAGNPDKVQVAQVVQADLEKLGFEVNLEVLEEAAWIDRVIAGDFGMNLDGLGGTSFAGTLTISYYLRPTDNVLWPGGMPPAEFTDAITAAREAVTEADLQAAFEPINSSLLEHAWFMPYATADKYFVASEQVHDVDVNTRWTIPDFAKVWLSTE